MPKPIKHGIKGMTCVGKWRGYRIYVNSETGTFNIVPGVGTPTNDLYNPDEIFLTKLFARTKIDEINGKLDAGVAKALEKKWEEEKKEYEEIKEARKTKPEKPFSYLKPQTLPEDESREEEMPEEIPPAEKPNQQYCINVKKRDGEVTLNFPTKEECDSIFKEIKTLLINNACNTWFCISSYICRLDDIIDIRKEMR